MDHEDEHSFLEKLAAGDSECLERVLEHFRPKLVRIVAKHMPRELNRRADAEDVVQQALISFTLGVYDKSYHFSDMTDVEHLLVSITLNRLRRAERDAHASKRDVDCEDSDIEELPGRNPGHEAADFGGDPLERLIAADLLRAVLERLPSGDRDIVHYLLMGCTIEETASKVGCGRRHVDQVLAKARRHLANLEKDE